MNWSLVEDKMNEREFRMVRVLVEGIPIVPTPFEETARIAGVSEEELLAQIQAWKADGTIRRFGAVVRHQQVGYTANAMVVWNVPDEQAEEFGARASSFHFVSHCYQRPRFEGFPYNIYTMIHGTSREECELRAKRICEVTGVQNYVLLHTLEEFKKSPPSYFKI